MYICVWQGAELHPLPYSYYNTGVDVEVMATPEGVIQVRSMTCEFALDFYPNDRDTKYGKPVMYTY